jgi:hypothetical protein
MQIEWLSEKQGFVDMLFVGFRKDPHPPGKTQRVGTVILKRSYSIDASSGVLRPLDDPVPIFIRDRQDNLVRNSDFEVTEDLQFPDSGSSTKPALWIEDGATADLVPRQNLEEEGLDNSWPVDFVNKDQKNAVRLSGTDPGGRLISDRPISFPKPLGGRHFQFSFYVRTDIDGAKIDQVYLREKSNSDENEYPIRKNIIVGKRDVFQRITGEWFSEELTTQDLALVLPVAKHPTTGEAVTTYYNMVQLEERDNVSEWDPDYVLRCESDLVPYKPQSDIIVSGFARDSGTYRVVVQGDGYTQTVLERGCRADEKALFGWEPRATVDTVNSEVRLLYRGHSQEITFSRDGPPEWPATTPEKDPLPDGFDNAFFNGYLRVGDAPAYLSSDARISVMRKDSADNYSVIYAFSLAGERFDAAYYVLAGPDARDSEAFWKRHALEMNLDTLVIEPDNDTCYAVWRGVWDFDQHADGDYRKIEIVLL